MASQPDDKVPAGSDMSLPSPLRMQRYEFVDRIGKGGMGLVYLARDTALGRMVAVKMLVEELEGANEARERFYREARAAGQLLHRNIVTIYDFGEEDGRAYIVMELLTGESLVQVLKDGSLPIERRIDIMMQVCDGLGFAHGKSIVHRDVKPGNLLLTPEGVVKILDFGLARIASSSLTRSGFIMGTPEYMSPEQVQGKPVDQRSDIFSAGAVFYQLLTGRKPFTASTLPTLLQRVASERPEPFTNDEAPPELARIVMRALEKDPQRRYQSMQQMLSDLAQFAQSYSQETRELAFKAAGRYQEIEQLLVRREALGADLEIALAPEAVAAEPMLRDVPQFDQHRGGVLRKVPFGRRQVEQILEVLDRQHASLSSSVQKWEEGQALLHRGLKASAAGDVAGARALFLEAVNHLPESPRAAKHLAATGKPTEQSEVKVEAGLKRGRGLLDPGAHKEAKRPAPQTLAHDNQNQPAKQQLNPAEQRRPAAEGRQPPSFDQAQERAAREPLRIAKAALQAGDYRRAIWAAENALALHPSSTAARDILAEGQHRWSVDSANPSATADQTVIMMSIPVEDDTVSIQPLSRVTQWNLEIRRGLAMLSDWLRALMQRLMQRKS